MSAFESSKTAHDTAPAYENRPAAQGLHTASPEAAYDPAAHGMHTTSPAAEYVPAWHMKQSAHSVAQRPWSHLKPCETRKPAAHSQPVSRMLSPLAHFVAAARGTRPNKQTATVNNTRMPRASVCFIAGAGDAVIPRTFQRPRPARSRRLGAFTRFFEDSMCGTFII